MKLPTIFIPALLAVVGVAVVDSAVPAPRGPHPGQPPARSRLERRAPGFTLASIAEGGIFAGAAVVAGFGLNTMFNKSRKKIDSNRAIEKLHKAEAELKAVEEKRKRRKQEEEEEDAQEAEVAKGVVVTEDIPTEKRR